VNKGKLTPTDRNNTRMKSFYRLRRFYPLGKLALFVKVFGAQNLSLSPRLSSRRAGSLFCTSIVLEMEQDSCGMTTHLYTL
jgi:hypothetical protein